MFLHNFILHISDFISIPSLLFIVFKGFKKRLRDVENKCFDSYDITCTSETKTPNFPVSFYDASGCVRG